MNLRSEELTKGAMNNKMVEDYSPQTQVPAVEENPLRKLLNLAIDTYLKKDLGFFHRDDDRALGYKMILLSVKDSDLANKVFGDIKQEMGAGSLGTSKKLRERLTQALCAHFNITDEEINKNANRNTYSMSMWNYSVALVDTQVLQTTYDLIEKRLNKNIEMTAVNAPAKK